MTSGKITHLIKQPWNNITAKTGHKCNGTTLLILKIDSKGQKRFQSQVTKISQTTRGLSACRPACCWPAVRPSSTSAKAPDFSHDHCRIIGFMNLMF